MKKESDRQVPIRTEELNVLAIVLESDIKKKIVILLLNARQSEGMYISEIFQAIGGSKPSLYMHLTELVRSGILTSRIGCTSSSRRLVKLYGIDERHVQILRKSEVF